MQIQQIITDVRNELVESNAAYWTDAEFIALANRCERDFINRTRSLEGQSTLNLVTGQQSYPLPANWLSAMVVLINSSNTTVPGWQRLTATTLEKEAQVNQNFYTNDTNATSTPQKYWIWGKQIWFDPIFDGKTNGTILMFYKAKPMPMALATDQINLDDSFADAINAYIRWKAWMKEQELDKAQIAQAEYEQMVKQGHRWVKKEAGDLRNRIDIDSPQSFGQGARGFNPFQF